MNPTAPQPAPLPSPAALERRRQARRATIEALLDAGAPLPVEALNAETWPEVARVALTSTGLDSLATVEVAMTIEAALDIDEIPDDDLRACVTVGDLARAAERAMGRPS